MQTGIPNPIPIIQPVSLPSKTNDPQQMMVALLRILKDLTNYTNRLNQAVMTIVPTRTVGVSYSPALTDRIVNIDATAGNIVITLLSPGAYQNSNDPIWGDYSIILKRIDGSGNTVTVEAINGATIDGAATKTMNQWDTLRLRPYALYGAPTLTAYGLY